MNNVVLVNRRDEKVGEDGIMNAHIGDGKLHRAFTIFLVHNDKILLQKRNENKKTWPLFWDTACSSHPFLNEDYLHAGTRRLKEELGVNHVKLRYLGKFYYFSKYKNYAEKEICAVLVGKYQQQELRINKDEIEEIEWVDKKKISEFFQKEKCSPWLLLSFNKYQEELI
jgi:isopentenyl-diphosphate delta-isomerase